MNLSDYLKTERGKTAELAAALGVSASLVTQWAAGKPISAERCPAIESLTGGAVTRRDLRPDDWWLVWPELVTKAHPIPAAAAADR